MRYFLPSSFHTLRYFVRINGRNIINKSQAILEKWLAPFVGDPYTAYCRICRCKLHSHKKGLLAHAKSSKHKKSIINLESLANGIDTITSGKKIKKPQFNDQWLEDSLFSGWLRKIPNNTCKALCIACRSFITAGRSELVKHSQAAKHKKAILDGISENLPDLDLGWLTQSYEPGNSLGVAVLLSNSDSSDTRRTRFSNMPVTETLGLPLTEVVGHLNELAPLHLAEGWDNVGLLVQPTSSLQVHNIFLTIDLTEQVLEEAIKKKSNLIISYHPPIFRPLKTLVQKNWKERIMINCIRKDIAVYSPHTALDAVKGGLNDWLISAYGQSTSTPIQQGFSDPKGAGNFTYSMDILISDGEDITQALSGLENVMLTVKSIEYGCEVRVCCDENTLPKVVEILQLHPVAQLCSRITKLENSPLPGHGMGRVCKLEELLPLYEVVHRTKQHLDQTHVRLALSDKHSRDSKVQTIAVCVGSGGSVLRGVKADVYVTGEMSHHDVLDATSSGSSVILCEHSNSERGFLKNWAEQLKDCLGQQHVNVSVSNIDKDPLRVV